MGLENRTEKLTIKLNTLQADNDGMRREINSRRTAKLQQVRAIDRIDRIRQAKRAELDKYQESLHQVREEENKCKREFTQLLMSVWEEAQHSAENMEKYKAELHATKELLSESI